jgi:hypothetical protein
MYAPLSIMEDVNIGFALRGQMIVPYYIKEQCEEPQEDTQECRPY